MSIEGGSMIEWHEPVATHGHLADAAGATVVCVDRCEPYVPGELPRHIQRRRTNPKNGNHKRVWGPAKQIARKAVAA